MSNNELKNLLVGLIEEWTLTAITLERIAVMPAAAAYDNCAQDLQKVLNSLEKTSLDIIYD